MNWLVTLVFSGHLSTGLQTAIHFGAKSPFFPRSFSPICFPYLFPLFFPICFPYFSLFFPICFPYFSLFFPTVSILVPSFPTKKTPKNLLRPRPMGPQKGPPVLHVQLGGNAVQRPAGLDRIILRNRALGGSCSWIYHPKKWLIINNGYIPLKVIFMVINMVIFTINIVIFTINNGYYHSYSDFHGDQLMVIYPI